MMSVTCRTNLGFLGPVAMSAASPPVQLGQDRRGLRNLTKFAPNGKALSPHPTGFTGGGVEGIGFGLAIDAHDNVWSPTYGTQAVVKFDRTGKPLSPPDGYSFGGKLGQILASVDKVAPGVPILRRAQDPYAASDAASVHDRGNKIALLGLS